MNDKDEKWIKDIRNRMEDYSEPLPVELWENIETEISRPKVILMWKRWQAVAAAAAVVIAVSTLSLLYWSSDPVLRDTNIDMASNELSGTANIKHDDTSLTASVENNKSKSSEGKVHDTMLKPSVTPDSVYMPDGRTAVDKQVVSVVSENQQSIDEKTEANDAGEQSLDEKQSSKEKRINMMKADRETVRRNASYLAMSDKKHSVNNMQIGVVTGNVPYSSSNSFSGMSRLSVSQRTSSHVNNILVGDISDVTSSNSQMLFNNLGKETYTDVKHHIPVTVGATVKWNLNSKWALETGLNYTYLYSELRSGAISYVEDKQKLHYVGIPLRVQRSIWNNSIFSFYVSGGGMMEKCVSGTVETVYSEGPNIKSTETEKVNIKPLQFSVLASLGIQADFNKFLGVYLEPGMAYYFDDHSEVLTIRKDKPFNFNIQVGLRFGLNR